MSNTQVSRSEVIPNGPGAAAILAAGIGSGAMGVLALAGDAFASVKSLLTFYNPVGALSGVSTVAIVIWLVAWFVLASRWDNRNVDMGTVNLISFALLVVGVLLTFPPVMDLIQGR